MRRISKEFLPRSTKSPLKTYGFSHDGKPFWTDYVQGVHLNENPDWQHDGFFFFLHFKYLIEYQQQIFELAVQVSCEGINQSWGTTWHEDTFIKDNKITFVKNLGKVCSSVPHIVISWFWQTETWLMFGRILRSLHVSPRICRTYRAWSFYWEKNKNAWINWQACINSSFFFFFLILIILFHHAGAPTCFCLKASTNFDTPQKVMGKVMWGPS